MRYYQTENYRPIIDAMVQNADRLDADDRQVASSAVAYAERFRAEGK